MKVYRHIRCIYWEVFLMYMLYVPPKYGVKLAEGWCQSVFGHLCNFFVAFFCSGFNGVWYFKVYSTLLNVLHTKCLLWWSFLVLFQNIASARYVFFFSSFFSRFLYGTWKTAEKNACSTSKNYRVKNAIKNTCEKNTIKTLVFFTRQKKAQKKTLNEA